MFFSFLVLSFSCLIFTINLCFMFTLINLCYFWLFTFPFHPILYPSIKLVLLNSEIIYFLWISGSESWKILPLMGHLAMSGTFLGVTAGSGVLLGGSWKHPTDPRQPPNDKGLSGLICQLLLRLRNCCRFTIVNLKHSVS